ncbi:MAG: outer membrane protein assembly factor BamA [Pseudomonadales bacterium]|nr:outer membrane protein assembly factor BamA [Pseudomonadales bacterium]
MAAIPVFAVLLLANTVKADDFTVSDIRIQGLQRVSAGTVFNLMPVDVGDRVDEIGLRQLVRLIFRSGLFNDIRMLRDGNVLVVNLTERPAIESLELDGNKAIKSEALLEGLSAQGLAEGEIFKQATLEHVALELERQYVSQGRYGASIKTNVEVLPRNRVAIKIDIVEGKPSGIQHINFVGNHVFDQSELLDVMELKLPGLTSFYKNDDKYSREKLSGDLETLESYYQDRGYVVFEIESTQVSITPDKKDVYITIAVDEGEKYTVGEVELVGELNDIAPEILKSLLLVQKDQTFNRALLTATEKRITATLGNSGYTFASASGIPQVQDDGIVDVRFFVEAGKRAYVRRINVRGNSITNDEVVRREMRQLEGGWASTNLIDMSKVRLERLGYFSAVNVETLEVPGTDDQIDVELEVEEQPSGSISATVGYSQGFGLTLGAGYQENNVFGTGNSLGANISWSKFQRSVSFNYFNPYFTLDGVSRGYNIFYRESNFNERNLARFSTDSLGTGINFGLPIGETQRVGFGLNVEQTKLKEGFLSSLEILEYIANEGNLATNFKMSLNWSSSKLNRGLFPTRGNSQSLSLEAAVPGSDLQFYKVRYEGQIYIPVTREAFTLRLRTELGYGDAYGSTSALPFYEHFYAGGFGSVRGFEPFTLGPRSTPPPDDIFSRPEGDPFGGNALFELSAELIFPIPFIENSRSFRSVIFADAGNVFNTKCPTVSNNSNCFDFDINEFRYSVGVAVTWITPGLGPMSFSFSRVLNKKEFDRTEGFQFELGKTL